MNWVKELPISQVEGNRHINLYGKLFILFGMIFRYRQEKRDFSPTPYWEIHKFTDNKKSILGLTLEKYVDANEKKT